MCIINEMKEAGGCSMAGADWQHKRQRARQPFVHALHSVKKLVWTAEAGFVPPAGHQQCQQW